MKKSNIKNSSKNTIRHDSVKQNINKDLIDKISKLSYEESLEELDIIINNIKSESFLVDELKDNYLKASLYIEHCEKLLENIEQEIIEIKS